MSLIEVTRVLIPDVVLVDTETALRAFGRVHAEGLVLWLGQVAATTAIIEGVLVPPQTPIREETGVGYFVDGRTLFQISRLLEERRTRLIAQVHSHPAEAYHSSTDDRYAIVTTQGGFSLVVPDFAQAPLRLQECAIYRLTSEGWSGMSAPDVAAMFEVRPTSGHSTR